MQTEISKIHLTAAKWAHFLKSAKPGQVYYNSRKHTYIANSEKQKYQKLLSLSEIACISKRFLKEAQSTTDVKLIKSQLKLWAAYSREELARKSTCSVRITYFLQKLHNFFKGLGFISDARAAEKVALNPSKAEEKIQKNLLQAKEAIHTLSPLQIEAKAQQSNFFVFDFKQKPESKEGALVELLDSTSLEKGSALINGLTQNQAATDAFILHCIVQLHQSKSPHQQAYFKAIDHALQTKKSRLKMLDYTVKYLMQFPKNILTLRAYEKYLKATAASYMIFIDPKQPSLHDRYFSSEEIANERPSRKELEEFNLKKLNLLSEHLKSTSILKMHYLLAHAIERDNVGVQQLMKIVRTIHQTCPHFQHFYFAAIFSGLEKNGTLEQHIRKFIVYCEQHEKGDYQPLLNFLSFTKTRIEDPDMVLRFKWDIEKE